VTAGVILQPEMRQNVALLILRLAGLGLALGHGWAKVQALASGGGERLVEAVAGLGFPLPGLFAWAAALAEFAGGLCVALGLGTRVAAAFAGFTMAVAASLRHHAHLRLLMALGLREGSAETLKAWGSPELALAYLLCFTALVLAGPGTLSLDALLGRRR
jgi:putative oxidoreductase